MDETKYRERVIRLEKVGKVLQKIPPEVRSAAFLLLEAYIIGTPDDASASHSRIKAPPHTSKKDSPTLTMEEFFAKYAHDKPSDNAKLIAAFQYREFGTEPFSLDEIRQISSEVGITIPQRIDMTLEQAKAKGKKLFSRAGTGQFKITVHGEAYLKTTYGVSKGTRKPTSVTQ